DWRQCRPAPGSLFVVGDPKQSIYRFRRADIVTYNQVKEIVARHGIVVALSANFRAIEPLIEWVNRAFEAEFPLAPTAYSPANHPLQVGRVSGPAGQLTGIYALNIPDEHEKNDAAVDYEAALVARFIRHAIDAGLTVPRTPKELERGITPAVTPG